jgi:multidrug efflux pump subunit AcrB
MIGEAIHVQRTKGLDPLSAAVQGVKEMGGLVLLTTSTTIIAFLPMFFVPGSMGDVFRQIPAVVVAVLLVSLVEALFILAAHLSKDDPEHPWLTRMARSQQMVNSRLEAFVNGAFRKFITACLERPGVLLATAISMLLITIGSIAGGFLSLSFAPSIESDTVIAEATLPYGTPKRQSTAFRQKLVAAANGVLADNGMTSPGIFSFIGARLEGGEVEMDTSAGSQCISVLMALPRKEERKLSGREFARAWQNAFGRPGEFEALRFTWETKITGGEPLRYEVYHTDPSVARMAALFLAGRLKTCDGLTSVDDGIRAGKPQLKIELKDSGLRMGLTAEAMARQVRNRYHGAEALRYIRDGSEVKVMVRLNESDRSTRSSLEEILLKNDSGDLIPLTEVADITQTRAFTSLVRRNGKRIYPVTADIMVGISDSAVKNFIKGEILPVIMDEFPGVSVNLGGEEEESDEALTALGNAFLVVFGVFYLLLALHYNSYVQPLLILSVVPFSLIGAVWGHILLGYDLSIISLLGITAMTGVVVNDSLVLVTAHNRYYSNGMDRQSAILDAVCQRFRPILLTTLTTVFGLMPLLLETSEQAQFLIPAVISISFGLTFGSVITLVLVPGFLCLLPKKQAHQRPVAPGRVDSPDNRL